MGRKKKSKITYDSKETFTVIGLAFILLAIFFFVSIFTVAESPDNLFVRINSVFGNATIVTAVFLSLVGLKFLGVRFVFTKTISLFGQFLLLFLISALLTSLTAEPSKLIKLDGGETKGGSVGFYVVTNLLGDKIPTEPITKLVLIVMIAFVFPVALSMSLHSLVTNIKSFFSWIKKVLTVLFGDNSEQNAEEEENVERAANFGDFNKLLAKRNLLSSSKDSDEEDEDERAIPSPKFAKKNNAENVEVKEGSLGEDGLHQSELKYPQWSLPPLSLLIPFKKTNPKEGTINQNGKIIEQILSSFGIEAKVEDAYIGPSVVQYALNIPLGVNVKKISNLSENIALALGVDSKAVRIESIPDTTYLGIEVPRSKRDLVRIKELMSSNNMVATSLGLPVPIGKDINGNAVIGDIQKMPHLLIAGATGSGKSVVTNSFITSLIMKKTPDELKLILVDPKQVEFMDYNGIAHLLTPVITDMDKVVNALKWAVSEMETRYTVLSKNQVRDIKGFNDKMGFSAMPYIVIVIDEMADMMMTANKVDAENAIVRLAQKARAVGIHLILATQRPSVNVITGIIKANIPGRIGMSVTSSTDSRVILDRIGAESLMGHGDLLYKAPDKTKSSRLQSPLIEQEEVIRVVDYIKQQSPEIEYVNEIVEKKGGDDESGDILGEISGDNLIEQAISIVVQSKRGSSSYLQRRLNIGFNRAARLLEELEELGVVGPQAGSKPRDVLIDNADEFISQLKGE